MNTSGRLYDDFLRLLFLHTHQEASALAGEPVFSVFSLSCSIRTEGRMGEPLQSDH